MIWLVLIASVVIWAVMLPGWGVGVGLGGLSVVLAGAGVIVALRPRH